jgi:hypothetical protein
MSTAHKRDKGAPQLRRGGAALIIEMGPHKFELKRLEEMTVEELREECNMWRNMFLNIDDETRYILWLIGREAVLAMRPRGEQHLVIIARVTLQPKYLYILRTSRRYDPIDQNYKIENVLEKIEFANVLAIQEILQRVGVQSITGEWEEKQPEEQEGQEEQ